MMIRIDAIAGRRTVNTQPESPPWLRWVERGPAVSGPIRPARPTWWRLRNRSAVAKFGGIGCLELLSPFIDVGFGHRKRRERCGCLTVGDPRALDVVVDGQVDHLTKGPGRSCQPAQR